MAVNKLVGMTRHRLMLAVDTLKAHDRVMLQEALALAEAVHKNQYRNPTRLNSQHGPPYILHPMRVAMILLEELGMRDKDALAAALLHDVVEDSNGDVSISDIEGIFGMAIAMMVSVLTKPPRQENVPRDKQLDTYYHRLARASIPTRLVKLCDRLDNMRETQETIDEDFKRRYLMQTRDIYLPIADATDTYLYEELTSACNRLEEHLGL